MIINTVFNSVLGFFVAFGTIVSEQMTLEERDLAVSAKAYSSEESEYILRADLVARGFIPVEVTILNQGDHTYAISMASTAMPCAKPKEIAWKFTKRGIPTGVGLKVLSLIFWPFSIPSTIHSIHTFKSHRSLVKKLTARGFKEDDEVVLPYSLVKRLLYVPAELYYQTFSVSLEDLTLDELVVIPVEVS